MNGGKEWFVSIIFSGFSPFFDILFMFWACMNGVHVYFSMYKRYIWPSGRLAGLASRDPRPAALGPNKAFIHGKIYMNPLKKHLHAV